MIFILYYPVLNQIAVIGLSLTSMGLLSHSLIKQKVEYPDLADTQLLIGYSEKYWIKHPIIVDMKITPHVFVSGLSNNGKTKMIEFAIKDKEAVILNADFKKDFTKFNCRKISEFEDVLKFLQETVADKSWRIKPLFIVIDELLVLSDQKEINTAITKLLAVARHRNIYIIGIGQSGEKEVLKYKHLFNTRICFRMVEESSYRTVLGYTPDQEVRGLLPRQFFYYSDDVGSGYTYDV